MVGITNSAPCDLEFTVFHYCVTQLVALVKRVVLLYPRYTKYIGGILFLSFLS